MRKTAAMQHFVVTGWPVAPLNSGPDGHYSELLENAKPCLYSLQNNSLLHCINMHTTQNPPLCSDEGLMIETSASQTDCTSWIYFINLLKSSLTCILMQSNSSFWNSRLVMEFEYVNVKHS